MASPLFVAESETAWNASTTPKTAAVAPGPGDMLVICLAAADLGSPTPVSFVPSGGTGMTYNLAQSISQASACPIYCWTAVSPIQQSFSVSVARSGDTSPHWGYNVLRFANCGGVGASAKATVATNAAPTLTFTTTGDGSAIVVLNADWAAVDGASRTWRTPSGATAITEQTYQLDAGQYASYVGFHASAGSPGSKTVGLSAPTGQTYSLLAVEILGAVAPVVVPATAVGRAGNW
jgi:hypothetical protein